MLVDFAFSALAFKHDYHHNLLHYWVWLVYGSKVRLAPDSCRNFNSLFLKILVSVDLSSGRSPWAMASAIVIPLITFTVSVATASFASLLFSENARLAVTLRDLYSTAS